MCAGVQALQYLDRSMQVEPGQKVMLLAKRDGSSVRFNLRAGKGEWVDRAPWKVEWGGGASVENPHFQRVHYCELLVRCLEIGTVISLIVTFSDQWIK